jgi:hypothetical protein
MRVRAEIDSASARQDVNRNAEVGVTLAFEHEGVWYPGQEWNDFGFRVLGFWLEQILRIRDGRSTTPEFEFLDGAFCLSGSVHADGMVDLVPQHADTDFRWQLEWSDVENAIIIAAKSLCDQASELALEPRGIEGIHAGLRRLSE